MDAYASTGILIGMREQATEKVVFLYRALFWLCPTGRRKTLFLVARDPSREGWIPSSICVSGAKIPQANRSR
jgi:hypothetical protein